MACNGVVLLGEERMQYAKAKPRVPGHAGQVGVLVEVGRWQTIAVHAEGAVRAAAGLDRICTAAVNLRSVPPVSVVRDVGRWIPHVGTVGRIWPRPLHGHGVLGPWVVLIDGDVPWVLPHILAVTHPIVYLKLKPRRH